MSERIRFRVNGRDVQVDVSANTPLLFVLRNHLDMRGTRHGCAEGDCGSCTVLIDGRATTSCNTPVEAVSDRDVETVEVLVNRDYPHPLVSAVLAEQAGQCGYCLAGILMRAKALLATTPKPGRKEIAAALDGHLCRCGAHNRIMRAIERAGTDSGQEAGA